MLTNSDSINIDKKRTKKKSSIKYGKYGYLFIAPFFISYLIFNLGPLLYTVWLSFMEYYDDLVEVGPNYIGLQNYLDFFDVANGWTNSDVFKSLGNTLIMWGMSFIPQIMFALLFAKWFTDVRVKLKVTGTCKVVMFLPNIITAASIAVLFFSMFASQGPIMNLLKEFEIVEQNTKFDFMTSVFWGRTIIAFIQFWMWYGNTMILFMAGILGINPSLFEAAMVDGATSGQIFRNITLPLLRPILLYTLVTSAIGGLQMYDIPQLYSEGNPADTTMTITMYIKNLTIASKDYGKASAASMVLFIVTLIISVIFFVFFDDKDGDGIKTKVKMKLKTKIANIRGKVA